MTFCSASCYHRAQQNIAFVQLEEGDLDVDLE